MKLDSHQIGSPVAQVILMMRALVLCCCPAVAIASSTATTPVHTQTLPPLTGQDKSAQYLNTVESLRDFHRAFAGDLRYYISSLDTNQNGDTTSTVLVTVLNGNSEASTFQIAPGPLKIHFVKSAEPMGKAVKVTILNADSGKDEAVILSFDELKRQLLITKGALPPTQLPESSPNRKAEGETATEKPRSPISPAIEPTPTGQAPAKSRTLDDVAKAYGANEIADVNVQFSQGRFYQIVRVKIAQVGDGFVLTSWESRRSNGNDWHHWITEDKPFAVLTFKNPAALNEFNLAEGGYIRAVGAFIKFKAFTMTGGSNTRLPVFECVGVEVDGKFIKTE